MNFSSSSPRPTKLNVSKRKVTRAIVKIFFDCATISKMFTWPAVHRVMRRRLQELVHSDAERVCLEIDNFEDYEQTLRNELEQTRIQQVSPSANYVTMQIRAMNQQINGLGYNHFY
jgi:hypothetical protein